MNTKNFRLLFLKGNSKKSVVTIWNDLSRYFGMVVKGVQYQNPEDYLYLDRKRKLALVKRIRKQIDKFGLTNDDCANKHN